MKNDYKNNSLKHRIRSLFRIVFGICLPVVAAITACSKMDEPYRDLWKDGEKIYPASPDSVKVHPGKDRIELTWLMQGDPSVTKAKVFWNNGKDSLEVPVQREEESNKPDPLKVMFSNMAEGSYSFLIYTYDDKGNRSIPVSAVGRAYGDTYINSLLIRLVESATFVNDSLKIVWGNPADATSIGTELVYTDFSGATRHVVVDPAVSKTGIDDYNFSAGKTFAYRSMFLPDRLAIDTFYTEYSTVRVKGPRVDVPKTGWTVTASSFDSRSGSSYRPPQNTIDNNPSTIWVNQISPQVYFPHWLMVDMGSVKEDIGGLSILVQNRNETPKSVEIAFSEDNVEWTTIGRFTVQNITTLQYLDFPETHNLRYFKVTAIEPYGNTYNAVIAEIGAFTR